MFCPQCGSSNAADARFCSSCGVALTKEPPSDAIAESVPQPRRRRSVAKTSLLGCLGLLAAIIVIALIAANMSGNNSGSENAAAPIATASVAPEPQTRIVAAFYRAISRKDFTTAWNLLSPTFKKDESFDKFRDGYATTQSVSVSVAEVPGDPQKVRASLDATDLINGNTVHSHFEGWWVLTQASDGHWLLDNGHFTKTQTDTSGQTANGNQNETPTTRAQGQDDNTKASAPATPVAILACCSANVDGMHYTVTGVQRTGMIPGDFNNVYNAQGEFIIVKLHVANETNQPATVNEQNFGLINNAGVKFAPNTNVTGLSTAFFDATINPGNSLSGVLVYDVPAGTDSAKYGIQCFANGATGDLTNWEAIRLPQSQHVGVGVLPQ